MQPRALVIAVVIVALASVGLAAAYSAGLIGMKQVQADELTRVLVIAASPDEDGNAVGQIIVVVDLSHGDAQPEAVSPALEVTIPGTSFDMLSDAYPFGGGAGTVQALARATDEGVLPYVALSPEQLADAVEAAGGFAVTLPAAVSVFDGDTLYSFKAGEQTLDSPELRALLKGAPYLTDSQRAKLDASLAEGLMDVLSASPGTLRASETDLAPEAISRLEAAL